MLINEPNALLSLKKKIGFPADRSAHQHTCRLYL